MIPKLPPYVGGYGVLGSGGHYEISGLNEAWLPQQPIAVLRTPMPKFVKRRPLLGCQLIRPLRSMHFVHGLLNFVPICSVSVLQHRETVRPHLRQSLLAFRDGTLIADQGISDSG